MSTVVMERGEEVIVIVAKTRSEAEQHAGDVVKLQAELDAIEAERDKRAAAAVEQIRLEYEEKIKAKGELALAKANAVQKWVEDHRAETFTGKEKSFETPIAKVGFRWGPPKLEVKAGLSWDDVLDRIKSAKKRFIKLADGTKISFLARFVRTKEEVARDQLKKDIQGKLLDEALARKELGVTVAQDEMFYITAR
jgi:phage host-nuclease inhibitor protein Gam